MRKVSLLIQFILFVLAFRNVFQSINADLSLVIAISSLKLQNAPLNRCKTLYHYRCCLLNSTGLFSCSRL